MTDCSRIRAKLDDHQDGTLAPEEKRAVESHLDQCPECAEVLAELGRLLNRASSLPKSISPPEDLWPGIERRIRAASAAGTGGPGARRDRPSPALWALAATALIAVSVGITLVLLRDPLPSGSSVTHLAPSFAGPRTELIAYMETETQYSKAREELHSIVRERRERLAPETRAVMDRNLAVIDRALRNLRAALDEDPSNRELLVLLKNTYRREQELLKRIKDLTTDA